MWSGVSFTMPEKDHHVLWTCYFDARCTRAMGRRVPRRLATADVSVKELSKACEQLGLSPRTEEGARHPRTWWMMGGRVLVERKMPKQRLIKEVAHRIKNMKGR